VWGWQVEITNSTRSCAVDVKVMEEWIAQKIQIEQHAVKVQKRNQLRVYTPALQFKVKHIDQPFSD
jgi:hypothetical protein